eukprot:CAMPEP_0113537224 /NCGR_PEP_ID=MMETSP0015_2-20120614/6712_1 /TAXON_ID=2838 /ORGANISM="Odontella" /LENGTH=320 /DNA_ID=CAMNT_0000436705 /DNA_START=1259 /DNA_END=2221 /DNA_ORIENTATION=- /assembly_acc=CAM_ASM_000160
MHKKWQEAAVQLGGEGARIVVSKKDAKPLILTCLRDSFRPMTITAIFKKLRAVVPSPVLKACLDEMALESSHSGKYIDDSDNDEGVASSKGSIASNSPAEGREFDGTVCIKLGRNVSGTLYYMKQDKLENGGDGLRPEHKSNLVSDSHKAEHEKDSLSRQIKGMKLEATRLFLEPTNKEATSKVVDDEKQMEDLQKKLDESRQLVVNEKVRKNTRKRVQSMADHWWKRRRLCMDFLKMIEECTDGAVNVKKCLAGSGQIDVESDEAVIKVAKECYKNRGSQSLRRPHKKNKTFNGVDPSVVFIGMQMNAKGYMSRVHADE